MPNDLHQDHKPCHYCFSWWPAFMLCLSLHQFTVVCVGLWTSTEEGTTNVSEPHQLIQVYRISATRAEAQPPAQLLASTGTAYGPQPKPQPAPEASLHTICSCPNSTPHDSDSTRRSTDNVLCANKTCLGVKANRKCARHSQPQEEGWVVL